MGIEGAWGGARGEVSGGVPLGRGALHRPTAQGVVVRVQLLSPEKGPVSPGPCPAGFPLRCPAASATPLCPTGGISPPGLHRPAWLRRRPPCAWVAFSGRHSVCPLPPATARSPAPACAPRARFAFAWAWAQRGGIPPFACSGRQRLACFPLNFLPVHPDPQRRLAGHRPRWCLFPSSSTWERSASRPPGCPVCVLHLSACQAFSSVSRACMYGCLPVNLGCFSRAQTHQVGHRFAVMRLCGSWTGAGSCVGSELMSVCVCPCRQTCPQSKALFSRRVAGPLPEGMPWLHPGMHERKRPLSARHHL